MLRKIYRKIFPNKITPPFHSNANIELGNEVDIHPSSLLNTSLNGKIVFGGKNYIGRNVEIGTEGLVEIGLGATIQDRCIILGDVAIGNYCTFAPNVYLSSGRHYYDHQPHFYIRDQDEMVKNDKQLSQQHSKKITIGEDCWLGINAVIMSGVTIGKGCVIGANSVVTKDVEPYTVVAGIPAKPIKKRLDYELKTELNFNVDTDLPYFYNGFFADMNSLNSDRKVGGIGAGKNFTVQLKKQKGTVKITLKKLGTAPASLDYNGQKKEITSEFTEINFNVLNEDFSHTFLVNTSDAVKKCVLIKQLKIV